MKFRSAIMTGATSMVGVACIEACLAQRMEVTAIVRPGTKRIDRLPQSPLLTIVECPIGQYAQLCLPEKPYDVFFHFAWTATSHTERIDPAAQTANIVYSIDAVRLAARMHCKRFIGAGSQAEYGPAEGPLGPDAPARPVMAYGIAKNAAQMMCRLECRRLGLEFCWARIFSIYGPLDNDNTLINQLLEHLERGETMPMSGCEQIWDYLYSADCGRAITLIAQKGKDSAVYCVGSGEGRPLKDYVDTIGHLYGRDLRPCMGILPYDPNQMMFLQADISSLQEDTGFTPAVSFEDGIRRTIEYKRGQAL